LEEGSAPPHGPGGAGSGEYGAWGGKRRVEGLGTVASGGVGG